MFINANVYVLKPGECEKEGKRKERPPWQALYFLLFFFILKTENFAVLHFHSYVDVWKTLQWPAYFRYNGHIQILQWIIYCIFIFC